MDRILQEERAVREASFDGITVYRIKTGKFKTNSMHVFFADRLCRERATKNALFPSVLKRGCEGHPTFRDLARKLEELYGATLDYGIAKKGEVQLMHFFMEFVSDNYVIPGDKLFGKAADLLLDVITKPVRENGCFMKDYVDQEKENLHKLIASRVNDKVTYAVERCCEVMCADEPFGLYEYGDVDDLKAIDEKNLYEHYKRIVSELPVIVFLAGDFDDGAFGTVLEKLKRLGGPDGRKSGSGGAEGNGEGDGEGDGEGGAKTEEAGENGGCPDACGNAASLCVEKSRAAPYRTVTEHMNVNQGKLSMGLRTCIRCNSPDYYPLLVYNVTLGGGGAMHSKLFQNVREKAGLAYYAFSRLEKFKGLMVISSGIEIANRDKVLAIMEEQLEAMRNGDISDYEIEASVRFIETGMKSLMDSQLQIVDFYISQALAGTDDTFGSVVRKVEKVTREDIVRVASMVRPDTVYFLTGKEG